MPLHARCVDPDADLVRIEWTLARSVAQVWAHVVDPGRLPEWLGRPLAFAARVGGEVLTDHGEGTVCRSVVEQIGPGRRFAVTWEFSEEPLSRVAVEVDSRAGGTLLTLHHTGLGELRDSYALGWVTHLTFLEASVEGTPLPLEQFWNLHSTLKETHRGHP